MSQISDPKQTAAPETACSFKRPSFCYIIAAIVLVTAIVQGACIYYLHAGVHQSLTKANTNPIGLNVLLSSPAPVYSGQVPTAGALTEKNTCYLAPGWDGGILSSGHETAAAPDEFLFPWEFPAVVHRNSVPPDVLAGHHPPPDRTPTRLGGLAEGQRAAPETHLVTVPQL